MRLFLAVDIDEAVRRVVRQTQQAIMARHGLVASGGLRWVAPANLHVTLRFLGEVDPVVAAEVVRACAEPLTLAPFSITFGAVGWLGEAGRSNTLVLPVVDGVHELQHVKQVLDARLPESASPDDPRPLLPHLTLARVRPEWRARVRAMQRGESLTGEAFVQAAPRLACPVDSVALYESELRPAGPRYTERARARLVGMRPS